MSALGKAWPKAIHFQELLAQARGSCERGSSCATATADDDARTLGELLLRAYAGGIVEFSLVPPRLVTSASEKPMVSALARLQSLEGTEVVNLRHFNLRVEDSLTRRLLQLLDGSRERDALLDELLDAGEIRRRSRGNRQRRDHQELPKRYGASLLPNWKKDLLSWPKWVCLLPNLSDKS